MDREERQHRTKEGAVQQRTTDTVRRETGKGRRKTQSERITSAFVRGRWHREEEKLNICGSCTIHTIAHIDSVQTLEGGFCQVGRNRGNDGR